MVLVIFAIVALIGQALNVLLCLALDNIFSPMVGGLTFVLLYMLVFAAAWLVSVRIAERREQSAPVREAKKAPVQRRHVLQTSSR